MRMTSSELVSSFLDSRNSLMDLSGLLKFYQGSNLILSFTIDHYISRMNIIMAKNWPFWILVEILLSTRSYMIVQDRTTVRYMSHVTWKYCTFNLATGYPKIMKQSSCNVIMLIFFPVRFCWWSSLRSNIALRLGRMRRKLWSRSPTILEYSELAVSDSSTKTATLKHYDTKFSFMT